MDYASKDIGLLKWMCVVYIYVDIYIYILNFRSQLASFPLH